MSAVEIVKTAIGNTFRSRLRTLLTVLAIFVGAFTLTLTNGLGVGIKGYIDTQVSSLGGDDLMSVTKLSTLEGSGFGGDDGPRPYDPDASFFTAGAGVQFEAMTSADVTAIEQLERVESVEPVRIVAPDYIAYQDGDKYELLISPVPSGIEVDLAAGRNYSEEGTVSVPGFDEPVGELVLPVSYVEPLGFASPEDAVGKVVTVALSDPFGNQHEVDAHVSGVMRRSLFGDGVIVSPALRQEMFAAHTRGLPPAVTNVYQGATIHLVPGTTPEEVTSLKGELRELGLAGITLEDQLGAIDSVITGLVWVLNGFAIIALIAAGFGIINTLLMSVQERTREIGLMKSMGMSEGRIFALFSTEAVFIGFLGSAIGALLAIVTGTIISDVLASGALSDLEGLRVLAFDPVQVLLVVLLVMFLAFVAGTLPATRAARQDPIEALRYE